MNFTRQHEFKRCETRFRCKWYDKQEFRQRLCRAWKGPFTPPDNALYLYQVLPKYLIGFQSYGLDSRVDARVIANVDGRTDVGTGERTEKRIPIARDARGRRVKKATI